MIDERKKCPNNPHPTPTASGGGRVLGKLPVPGHPTISVIVGQGPIALAVGAGGVVWTFLFSSTLSPSLWKTARYRLKCWEFTQHHWPVPGRLTNLETARYRLK